MHVLIRGAAGLLACLLVLPLLAARAQDAKKTEAKLTETKEPANTDKSLKKGQVTGKVASVNDTNRSMKLSVTYEIPKINQGEVQALQNHQRELVQGQAELQQAQALAVQAQVQNDRGKFQDAQNKIRAATQKIQNAQLRIAQSQAKMVTGEKKTQDIELTAAENVAVRTANPPVKFDGEGKVVKYTAKELADLRGDGKLPGYPADFADLTQNMIVTVTLVQKPMKTAPGTKGKDADAVVDLLEEYQPKMSVIVILADPTPK